MQHCRAAFERESDWSLVKPYMIDVSGEYDAASNEALVKHFETCKQRIDQAAARIEEEIGELRKDVDVWSRKTLKARGQMSRWHLAKIQFLVDELDKYRKVVAEDKLKLSEERKALVIAMQKLVQFLIKSPQPVMLKIKRVVAPISFPICYNQGTMKTIHRLKKIADAEIGQMKIFPVPFRSDSGNKKLVLDAVEMGVAAKKPGTPYFYELPVEDSLRVFLKSSKSPLRSSSRETSPLWPFQGDTSGAVEWVASATRAMAAWVNIEDEDKEGALSILLVRFLFYETYPLLYINSELDFALAHKMEKFCAQTPEQIGIQDKYLVGECKGRPVSDMFTIDSISSAPVEWFRTAIVKVCPLDAAYCIVKVHESLTVMAVLRDTARRQKAQMQDFCEKMPGFDDIFEIWLALIATVGNLNPDGLLNFISTYSKLPGFTARINVSLTYLEATMIQFKSDE